MEKYYNPLSEMITNTFLYKYNLKTFLDVCKGMYRIFYRFFQMTRVPFLKIFGHSKVKSSVLYLALPEILQRTLKLCEELQDF